MALYSPLKAAMAGASPTELGPAPPRPPSAAEPPAPPDPPERLSPVEEDRYLSEFEKEYDIPPGLYVRLIKTGENSDYTATSSAGAYGRAQLMEATARDMGVDRKNPVENLKGGAKYLKWLHDQLGDWPQAVAAYNDGIGNVRKAGGIPENPHVQDYVRRVMADGSTAPATSGINPKLEAEAGDMLGVGLKEEKASLKGYDAAVAKAEPAYDAYTKRIEENQSKLADLDKRLAKLRDATPDAPAERQLPGFKEPNPTNPMQTLAAVLPMLMLTSGKMGRNKGLALMKTMSGMLSGVEAGNDQQRKRYQEDFKAQTEQVLEQARLDHERYSEILQSLQQDAALGVSQMQMLAAKTDNAELRLAAQTHDVKAFADRMAMAAHVATTAGTVLTHAYNAENMALARKQQEERIENDRARLAETTRWHDENLPLKRMQAAEKLRNDVDKSALGKAYSNLDQYSHVIDNAATKIEDDQKLGSQEQAAFLDAFTKIITGGQAIRGFTLKLNTEHAGLADKAQVLGAQLAKGGPLSGRQEKEMIQVVRDYTAALSAEYQGAIARADSFAKSSGVIGADESVSPFEVDPDTLAGRAGDGGQAGAGLPPDLPSPAGVAENTQVHDENGRVVAVLRGGKWSHP